MVMSEIVVDIRRMGASSERRSYFGGPSHFTGAKQHSYLGR